MATRQKTRSDAANAVKTMKECQCGREPGKCVKGDLERCPALDELDDDDSIECPECGGDGMLDDVMECPECMGFGRLSL